MIKTFENGNIIVCSEDYFYNNIDIIKDLILKKCIVIVKGVFLKADLFNTVSYWFEYGKNNEASNPDFEFGQSKNFHRFDINPKNAAANRVMHAFCFNPWNNFEENSIKLISIKLLQMQYAIAEIDSHKNWRDFQKDGYILSMRLTHYPVGGGYYVRHKDPSDKFFANVILIMTERGQNYTSGGLSYGPLSNALDVESYLQAGDVVLMDQTIPHSVEPIDPDLQLSFNSVRGRWMMMWTLAFVNTKFGDYSQHAATASN